MGKIYRCFFCDEVFKTRREAWEHFGDETPCGSDVPACIDPLRADERERNKSLKEAQRMAIEGMRHEERADDLMWDRENDRKQLQHYFGEDCTTLWQAGDRYDNLRFELKLAREEIELLKSKIAS